MTWAAVGSEINSTSSSFSLTPGGTGHLILLEVVNETNNTVTATALSSSNVTWTQIGTAFAGTTNTFNAAVFAGRVTSASLATVTVTWSGATPGTVRINGQEFSSTVGTWAIDGSQGNLDGAGTNTWPSLTPSVSGALYFGWGFDSGTATGGATSGYVYVTDPNGNGLAYRLSCPSGTPTAPVWGDSGMKFGVAILVKEVASTQAYAWGDEVNVTPGEVVGFSCWVMSPQGCSVQPWIDFYGAAYSDVYSSTYLDTYGTPGGSGFVSTATGGTVWCPPMTPVFLNLTNVTVPGGVTAAFPHPTIVNSPASGTQLYFDRARMSPVGFQVPYMDDVQITEDIQYLYNDIAVTRNVDQASYRARDATSRSKYYPRIYTRTIFSSVDDANAVQDCANFLLTNFASPALRVPHLVIDAASNPEAWPFVLSADIGDSVSFTRSPVGVAAVTGTFTILSVEFDIARDKAQFTYTLAPGGVF